MSTGKVYLVGAGPGDEKLITVRGLECLRRADTIVYDRLANPRLLRFAKPDAEFIFCGKFPKHHTLRQEAINELLVRKAREGRQVVRLKGGDPSVFGRVGEEAAELVSHGIEYEIVPGITAGIAAPAYAGIPVTHREYGTSFAVVTGHAKTSDGKPSVDWMSLGGIDTLAFYMGVKNLRYICDSLIQHGRHPQTPVALVRWGTMGGQQTVQGTLETIVHKVEEIGLENPAITLVGDIVALRDQIRWFENKPLFGRRILVARTGGEQGNLADALSDRGADVIEYPYFSVCERSDESTAEMMVRSVEYERILFTSPESAAFFFAVYRRNGRDIRELKATFYTLSRRTGRKLQEMGFASKTVEPFSASNKWLIIGESSILENRKQYEREWGACDLLALYDKKECREYNANMVRLLRGASIDTIVFPSAASVDILIRYLERAEIEPHDILSTASLVCMGDRTAEAIQAAGYLAEQAASPTLESLIACLVTEKVSE
ncbi:uroporphyrinogen-III C-methyltransferase [Aneurinibacillus aneurinilyticus]|jgi:uroporphyrinogen III methyltransferase/synthase|uniref:Uroporphyrinogen-III C-methyltransferase n=2 Tax=Aneurinibacillus aneurinilyticus TaxID=1391 RepID=A0A848D1H9_ANEAE|nr:uroporphyrinogen-III C-methyltransferase [Aneurinibacillus aneurinilyticus]ERI05191.1 uroporphyrinogen-III C-methyltransferase [Aneurinibacillus aneurinilyticus ATCC 12856]MCI1694122.1 uroporphyrinogen-III C-methyltransferase [Aneurinibacillus aneurinilyticus]MED0672428.1 uroporphyrinogen-III C-methyltransferase [Aneurinibacillus aneurinilyticus]MED0708146.1 uroporphyrinogen-III C-methyltransferase [Aneurinibacillus aneurinilyticus]MED0721501.1 uroporphyrinogen-III C-methyltransferase [Aneu